MYPYIMSPSSIALVIDGENKTVNNTHPNFTLIREAIKNGNWAAIPHLIDIPAAVRHFAQGQLEVFDDVILYKDEALANPLVDRILRMMNEGFDVTPMVNFLENLMQNPSRTAVQELYLFLEANGIPITPDGHFLAYKRVRPDYKDIHSRTFDNSVGAILEMDRNKVDEDRQQTCSYGFHVCSISYIPHFSAHSTDDHVMIVKVNPRDVVAVPADYHNAKMRVARYEVIAEYKGDWNRDAFTSSVVDQIEPDYTGEEEELYDYAVRLRALDDEGDVHEVVVSVKATDEENAKDQAEWPDNGPYVDETTAKAVSVTLVD